MRTIMITMSLGRVHGQVCTKAITQRIKSIDSKIIRCDFISFISVFRCRFYANYSEIMQQKTIELCNSSCALEENRQRHIFTDELSVNVSPNHRFFSKKESLGRWWNQLFETEFANLCMIITSGAFPCILNKKFSSIEREMNPSKHHTIRRNLIVIYIGITLIQRPHF